MQDKEKTEQMQRIYRNLVEICDKRSFYVVNRLWQQGFGIIAMHFDHNSVAKFTALIGSIHSKQVFTHEDHTLDGMCRGALNGMVNAAQPFPVEAEPFFRRQLEEYQAAQREAADEKDWADQSADKPN